MSRRRSVNLGWALQNSSAAELFRIPRSVGHAIIAEDNSCGDIGGDWICGRPHLKATVRSADDRVDSQFGIHIGREIQSAMNADRLEFSRNYGINSQRHPLRNDDSRAGGWELSILPDGGIRPVTGCNDCVGCLIG